MRQRTLKPGFFTNEDLSTLPAHERLLFAGLMLIADKAGRLEDRPLRIKAQVFPYELVDVEPMLESLQRAGFVHRYSVGASRYLCLPNFAKHQHPHPKEPESLIPAPVESRGETRSGRVSTMCDQSGSSVPSGPSGSSGPSYPSPAAPGDSTAPAIAVTDDGPRSPATPEDARAVAVKALGPPTDPEWLPIETYARAVLAVYSERRGKPDIALSSVEFALVRKWWEWRIPPRVVAMGLRTCKGEGRSLLYYGPAIEEEAARRHHALAFGGPAP